VGGNPNDTSLTFENTLKTEIDLNGVKAYRRDFNEYSLRPNLIPSSRIYLNHNNKGYIIYSGLQNTSDETEQFNQILSTFQFTE